MNYTFLVLLLYWFSQKSQLTTFSPKNVRTRKEALGKGKSVAAIFIDLSKAFDTLNHDLLTAKLEAYGFSKNSLNYIQSYLNNRLQRTNVNDNFSLWKDIFLVFHKDLY